MTESQWHGERRISITGTDIPRLLGIYFDGEAGPRNVYLEKTAPDQVERKKADLRMRKGQAMQPFIGELFAEHADLELVKPDGFGLVRHPVDQWQAASLDMMTLRAGEPVELKDVNGYPDDDLWGPCSSDFIPQRVLCQLLWQIRMCDTDLGFVGALFAGVEFRWYRIARDLDLESMLVEIATDFRQRVVTGSGIDGWQHALIAPAIDRANKVIPNKCIMLSAGALELATSLERAAEQKRLADREYDRCKAAALKLLGDSERGMMADGRLLVRERDRAAVRIVNRRRGR